MTQKVKWRTTHIVATVIGAALLSLTVRHALAINSPDLRTGVLAISSMAAIMVGLTLLARFLSSRQQPTLYLTLGFLGSGLLLGVHAMFSSALIRDTAQWSTMLVEASDIMSDGLISLSFLAGWAAWRWQAMLEKRVPTLARLALVIAVVATLAFVALALAAHPAFSKTADLVWVAFFVAGLIGFGLKNSRRPDTLERWLILAGIFLIYGQVVAGILGDGAGVGQVGTAEVMTFLGYFAAFVGSVISTYELFERAERAMQIARGRNEELQVEVAVRKRAEEESRQLALIDPLTSIYNRRGFTTLATHVREIARRQKRPVHLLLIDLDRFKRINDTFGHAVGDKALVEFAQILTATFRKSDVVARTGGDEFCVLLTEPDEGIQTALARLRQNVDDSNVARTRSYRLEFSIGIARAMPDDDESIHALVEMADEAMYEEKRLREGAA
ncbi:MAG TPA: GGDEF domain-containing protein [Candidatus Dormibacteraeota bacterium]|nr:GGDEF domain-containing protein [Candidatus Dormibacteraeota bacterium]